MTISSRSPSAPRCASSRLSYGRYDVSPRTRSVGTRTCSKGGGSDAAVGGDDRGLRVPVAEAIVLALHEVAAELLLDEPARRARELALLVAAVDPFVEGDIRALPAGVLRRVERDRGRHVYRGVEQDEARDELRGTRGELEREAAAERVPDETGGLGADGIDDRGEVALEVPRGS